jgi:hypothetical protein
MSEDLGQTFEGGTSAEQARAAASELQDRRRQNGNPYVEAMRVGDYIDHPHIRDENAKVTKDAESKNQNVKGLDARRVAEALTKYRNVDRPAQTEAELAANHGLDPNFEPLAPRQAQPEQPEASAADPSTHPAVAAEAQRYAQARDGHIQAIGMLVQHIENGLTNEFSDIRNMDDAAMLAQIDPARYQRWDAAQKQRQLAIGQNQQLQEQARVERQQAWDQWSAAQDRAFAQHAGAEIDDPVRGPKIRQAAFQTLHELGFSEQELSQSWNAGQLRDARVQALVLDAARYRQAKASAAKAAAKPIPQVQRPGTGRPRGADVQDHGGELSKGDAVRLLLARRNAAE